ncbi:hypothetical protein [Vibrio sp. 10N.247.311.51]|uniref:hypothetical protein n=1 Tax=Vibrio sp. 10N.247.311.51 TaxID=3229996 RepID=UPI00354BF876
MDNYLTLEVTLKALQEFDFNTPEIVINMKYGFVIRATAESLHLTVSYFQDGPYQTLEIEFGAPQMQPQKYNYMGRYNNIESLSIESWLKEKLNKAHSVAHNPKDLPLYTLKLSQIDLKV